MRYTRVTNIGQIKNLQSDGQDELAIVEEDAPEENANHRRNAEQQHEHRINEFLFNEVVTRVRWEFEGSLSSNNRS